MVLGDKFSQMCNIKVITYSINELLNNGTHHNISRNSILIFFFFCHLFCSYLPLRNMFHSFFTWSVSIIKKTKNIRPMMMSLTSWNQTDFLKFHKTLRIYFVVQILPKEIFSSVTIVFQQAMRVFIINLLIIA